MDHQAIFYYEPQPSPDLSFKHKENDMIDKSWVKDLLKKTSSILSFKPCWI